MVYHWTFLHEIKIIILQLIQVDIFFADFPFHFVYSFLWSTSHGGILICWELIDSTQYLHVKFFSDYLQNQLYS